MYIVYFEKVFTHEAYLDNFVEGFSKASSVIDSIPAADVVPKSEVANDIEAFEKKVGKSTTIMSLKIPTMRTMMWR